MDNKRNFSSNLIQKYPILNEYTTKSGVLNKAKKNKNKILEIINEEEKNTFITLFSLIKNNNEPLILDDINNFSIASERGKNDISNKKRELIINNIINDNIPLEYYDKDSKWYSIASALWKFLEIFKPHEYTLITSILIAGRKNNDFNITYYNSHTNQYTILKKEFKYNASKINDCPQCVSPMKPSKFMTKNFEEYHYDNHMYNICKLYDFTIPIREDFLNQIHYEKPECMKIFQDAYYKGAKRSSQYTGNTEDINKYQKCKEISNFSISNFLKTTNLNVTELNKYLLQTQKDKHYMLYDTNTKTFKHEKPDIKDYTIKSTNIKKTQNSFVGETQSGKTIKILLRWKNGNGIAFPAFQIR